MLEGSGECAAVWVFGLDWEEENREIGEQQYMGKWLNTLGGKRELEMGIVMIDKTYINRDHNH